nr:MAG TPA: hypothetical protein [Crassvirales sp.]
MSKSIYPEVELVVNRLRNKNNSIIIVTHKSLLSKVKINKVIRDTFDKNTTEVLATFTQEFKSIDKYDGKEIVDDIILACDEVNYKDYELYVVDSKNEEINLHIIGVIDKYFVDNTLYNSKIKRVLVIL